MKAFANFLKIRYKMGRITPDQIKLFSGDKLTLDEVDEILSVKVIESK